MIAVTGYTPDDLLDAAEELLATPRSKAIGLWSRAAAHLCRQALEASIDAYWASRLPGTEACSMRAKLTCLRDYLKDDALSGRIAYAWSALSDACHHRAYATAPTAAELRSWIETAREAHAAFGAAAS